MKSGPHRKPVLCTVAYVASAALSFGCLTDLGEGSANGEGAVEATDRPAVMISESERYAELWSEVCGSCGGPAGSAPRVSVIEAADALDGTTAVGELETLDAYGAYLGESGRVVVFQGHIDARVRTGTEAHRLRILAVFHEMVHAWQYRHELISRWRERARVEGKVIGLQGIMEGHAHYMTREYAHTRGWGAVFDRYMVPGEASLDTHRVPEEILPLKMIYDPGYLYIDGMEFYLSACEKSKGRPWEYIEEHGLPLDVEVAFPESYPILGRGRPAFVACARELAVEQGWDVAESERVNYVPFKNYLLYRVLTQRLQSSWYWAIAVSENFRYGWRLRDTRGRSMTVLEFSGDYRLWSVQGEIEKRYLKSGYRPAGKGKEEAAGVHWIRLLGPKGREVVLVRGDRHLVESGNVGASDAVRYLIGLRERRKEGGT